MKNQKDKQHFVISIKMTEKERMVLAKMATENNVTLEQEIHDLIFCTGLITYGGMQTC